VLEVDGPEGGTDLHETAAAFGRALGREVKAVQLPEVAWQSVLEAIGTPTDRTGLYIEMVTSFNSGWIHFGNPGTEKFHGPTTVEVFAQELALKRSYFHCGLVRNRHFRSGRSASEMSVSHY
jgi:NAD(P)H dehydrogenase (quinone)